MEVRLGVVKVYLCVTIDRNLFKQIEEEREMVKRSTFVDYLLKLGFKTHNSEKRAHAKMR